MFLDPPNGQKRLGTYVHVEHKISGFGGQRTSQNVMISGGVLVRSFFDHM